MLLLRERMGQPRHQLSGAHGAVPPILRCEDIAWSNHSRSSCRAARDRCGRGSVSDSRHCFSSCTQPGPLGGCLAGTDGSRQLAGLVGLPQIRRTGSPERSCWRGKGDRSQQIPTLLSASSSPRRCRGDSKSRSTMRREFQMQRDGPAGIHRLPTSDPGRP